MTGPLVVERGRRQSYFSAVPTEMIYSDLPPRAVKVYCGLLQFGNTSGERCPSMKGLADKLSMNPKTVSSALDDLEAAQWIDVERDRKDELGHRMNNRYFVHECLPGADSLDPEIGPRDPGLDPKIPDGKSGTDLDNQSSTVDNQGGSDETSDEPDPAIRELCEYLERRAAAQHDRSPKKITKTALRDMGYLLNLGEKGLLKPEPVPPAKIRRAIDVIFDELNIPEGPRNFCWADVIESPGSLREGWSRIRTHAKKQRGKASPAASADPFDVAWAAYDSTRGKDHVTRCQQALAERPDIWAALQHCWPHMDNRFENRRQFAAAYTTATKDSAA